MKNPIIAVILNMILPGVGYLYVGRRRVFAGLLIGALILSTAMVFDPLFTEYLNADFRPFDWIYVASLLLLEAAFMYDAYTETLRRNAEEKTTSRTKKRAA